MGGDRSLQLWLVAILVVQLILGAVQRHLAWGLIIHISLAAVIVMLAVIAWFTWAYTSRPDILPTEFIQQIEEIRGNFK